MQVQELTDEGYKCGARFWNKIEDAGPQTNPHTPPAETSQKRMRKNPNNGRKTEGNGNTLRYKTTARDEIWKKHNAHSEKPGNSVRFKRKTVASWS